MPKDKIAEHHAKPCETCGHRDLHGEVSGCVRADALPGGRTQFCPCTHYIARTIPVTPYAGTSGWSGSSASEERAVTRDAAGLTSKTQKAVLAYVATSLRTGATIADVRKAFPEDHHGTLSGAMSNLQACGLLARLTERRDKCQVYVLPEHVAGREIAPQGRRRPKPSLTEDEHTSMVRLETAGWEFGDVERVLAALKRLAGIA